MGTTTTVTIVSRYTRIENNIQYTVSGVGKIRKVVGMERLWQSMLRNNNLNANVATAPIYALQGKEETVIEKKECCFQYFCPYDSCFIAAIECFINGLFASCCPASRDQGTLPIDSYTVSSTVTHMPHTTENEEIPYRKIFVPTSLSQMTK